MKQEAGASAARRGGAASALVAFEGQSMTEHLCNKQE